LRLLLIDQAMVVALATVCAISLKRADILLWVVAFPLLRLVNSAIMLRTFWLEVVRRQHALDWFSVGRYRDGTGGPKAPADSGLGGLQPNR